MLSTAMIHDQWQRYLQTRSAGDDGAAMGIAYVPELAAVRFEGSNARSFLQGYLTCDTARLEQATLLAAAVCNLKGRVVLNGWCAAENDENVLLVLHTSLVDRLAGFLKPYLMFSRNTALVDLRSTVLLLAGLDLPEASGGLAIDARRRLFPFAALADAQALWEGHPHLPGGAWLAALSRDGVPLVSATVSETFLPQMLNLHTLGAVDFEKGCYLGQEVVARAQHRGQVKRRLTRLLWHGPAAPEPGAEVTDAAGKAQGVVLQSAADGADSGVLLAVLRQEAPEVLRQGETDLRTMP